MKYQAGSRRRASEYERALIEWWKKNRIFERSVLERPVDNSYVFYDGPPFITGDPHHGTLLSSIVKDAVPRFWTMRGFRVERRWGWDCHGLPAENFVEKQLGITDRREIGTKWSLEEYINKARESMVANSAAWEGTIDRIGRWVDFKGAYRTMDKDFMESVWWAFKTLYEAGKIYEGRKVLMYDTKFATPVSKSEVTMDNEAYREVTDPSAYVKFKTEKGILLAWTTTPWTLPGNLLLAVNPSMKYALVQANDEKFIVGKTKVEKLFDEFEILEEFKGTELVGLEYEPLFDLTDFVCRRTVCEGCAPSGTSQAAHLVRSADKIVKPDTFHVLSADFVSDEDGTGIVHIAPAYGEDDYSLAEQHEVDFVDVLDENGYYLPEMQKQLHKLGVRDTDEHGIQIWAGNKFIAKCLEEAGIVWKIEYIKHEYPFNPRSNQRIMYRAFPSWFFNVQGSKPLMIAENENINWFPAHLKHGRFEKNIEQAPDWNLSRDRFWATAMPVWKGDKGTVKVVGSYNELYELSGQKLDDYHRPWVDAIEFDIDGEHFTRVEKVLDCWFESGSMPFAQLHYPFENKEKFERNYPADFIVEYVGQVRAWFYYVHCVNTALAECGAFGPAAVKGAKNAYKNVITTGTLAGDDGRKMSKSYGNYTNPNELMDKLSADALRMLLLSSPVLSGEDFALIDKDVSDTARKLTMVWNVYDFFTTYASVDGFDSDDVIDPKDFQNNLDKWIVSRVWQLRNEITRGMEKYDIPSALGGVLPFLDDLSNWFVRRSRRRFWKSEDDADKAEAYSALYYVLTYFAKIVAPFAPFLAEELYQQMTGGEEGDSVHLLDWPEAGEINEQVLVEMATTRKAIADGLALRMLQSETEEQIKVRQPLNKFVYTGEQLSDFYEQMIMDEVNVKKVECGKEAWLDKTLTEELRAEGFVRELIRAVQNARKKADLMVDDRIRLSVSCEVPADWLPVLKAETLCEDFAEGNYAYDEIAKVNGQNVTISLEKI